MKKIRSFLHPERGLEARDVARESGNAFHEIEVQEPYSYLFYRLLLTRNGDLLVLRTAFLGIEITVLYISLYWES